MVDEVDSMIRQSLENSVRHSTIDEEFAKSNIDWRHSNLRLNEKQKEKENILFDFSSSSNRFDKSLRIVDNPLAMRPFAKFHPLDENKSICLKRPILHRIRENEPEREKKMFRLRFCFCFDLIFEFNRLSSNKKTNGVVIRYTSNGA